MSTNNARYPYGRKWTETITSNQTQKHKNNVKRDHRLKHKDKNYKTSMGEKNHRSNIFNLGISKDLAGLKKKNINKILNLKYIYIYIL